MTAIRTWTATDTQCRAKRNTGHILYGPETFSDNLGEQWFKLPKISAVENCPIVLISLNPKLFWSTHFLVLVTSGYRRVVNEIFTLLGCYVA
jgi:hypothetical protein